MFDLSAFIEKNGLTSDQEENVEKLQTALAKGEAVGFVCRGEIGGMAPAGLEMLGINSIFPNGIYVSLHAEEKCREASLTLIPRALVLGIDLTELEREAEPRSVQEALKKQLSDGIGNLLERMQYYPAALREIAVDAGQREGRAAAALEVLAEERAWSLSYYEKEAWEPCVEALSEIDRLVGKKAEDALCERLARCGAKEDGQLLTKQMEIGGFCVAAAQTKWSVAF